MFFFQKKKQTKKGALLYLKKKKKIFFDFLFFVPGSVFVPQYPEKRPRAWKDTTLTRTPYPLYPKGVRGTNPRIFLGVPDTYPFLPLTPKGYKGYG